VTSFTRITRIATFARIFTIILECLPGALVNMVAEVCQ
jgi:hypothetical protein